MQRKFNDILTAEAVYNIAKSLTTEELILLREKINFDLSQIKKPKAKTIKKAQISRLEIRNRLLKQVFKINI